MFRNLISLLVLAVFCAASAARADIAKPESEVILTVSGAITATNSSVGVQFDRPMLEALDWRQVDTYTSFTSGLQHFAGPTVASVLEAVGADGETLRATAINDYATEFPLDLVFKHSAILAMDIDGKPMRIRDKGPIWIVFPLTEAEAKEKPFDNEMVWQLAKLHIGP
ncbi:oxidoreductase [Marinovum sp. 2_MG-2023]|uniref:oxidoreductase n=1 Tax=Roseobacteraceae TaxID=2854170 RepID=UPI001FCFDCA1|nr:MULTISPECIES: oxidoreductase [Roseobacteraceae]MCJ7872898.1 oxidoreductase [Phaeobacter sp. J2-8]MDO6732645.1 oxidoreductase [Marinovum sp. 2_MG-2023]MDO6781857.1 oxidoreductase [Marinovum sp. 1_MG-2023]